MHGAYNHSSYYHGMNGHNDTRYIQGSLRNSKPKDELKHPQSASSLQNGSPSSQHVDRYPPGPRYYNKYQTAPGTKSFFNSQKRWTERPSPNSNPTVKLRHGPSEPSHTQKPAERVNNAKKSNKPQYKQPVDDKENLKDKESDTSNNSSHPANRSIVVVRNSLTASKGAGDARVIRYGRKQHSGRQFHSSSGSDKRRKEELFSKQWDEAQSAVVKDYFCFYHDSNIIVPTYCTSSNHIVLKTYSSTPMYRCLLKASTMVVNKPPESLTNGSSWDNLSTEMWDKFVMNQQCEDVLILKIRLWEFLYCIIRTYYPRYGLYLVGSSLNGFGLDASDVDLCLMIHNVDVDQRTNAIFYLSGIYTVLGSFPFLEDLQLIHAKVPILKFKDLSSGLTVDLNCNNSVGIRNTHLLNAYSQLDWRVKPLVVLVKLWAQCHDINDAKCMTLSSYSLTLMVIHFLQYGVRPAVLPCLQRLHYHKFNPSVAISSLTLGEEMQPYASDSKLTLGELLLRFFKYYSSFNFSKYAISVRLGSTILVETCRYAKALKNDPMQWKFINIEEPFELTNTARSVHDSGKYQRIVDVIKYSADRLAETKSLDAILTPLL